MAAKQPSKRNPPKTLVRKPAKTASAMTEANVMASATVNAAADAGVVAVVEAIEMIAAKAAPSAMKKSSAMLNATTTRRVPHVKMVAIAEAANAMSALDNAASAMNVGTMLKPIKRVTLRT